MDSGISSVQSTQYVENMIKKARKNDDSFSGLIQPPGRDMNAKRGPYERMTCARRDKEEENSTW